MYFLNNKTAQIDDLLARAAEKLQLDRTRREKIESSYKAIQEVLENDPDFFDTKTFEIYPQGSVRIGTTVKPLSRNEFDLDIVLHIQGRVYEQTDPMRIFNELKRVLQGNGTYKDKVESKTRCVRLNYADNYHMDILPGCQHSADDENKIVIPDRELKEWLISNPRGYAKWFLNKAETIKMTLLEKAYEAEEIPSDDFAAKKPLQRAVQIIKRYRDLFFEETPDYATSSIVLTTLAGQLYQNQDSIFETIDGIVSQIYGQVNLSRLKRIKVLNPVDSDEDFTDKWGKEPKYYSEFIRFVESLYKNWQKLKEDNGIVEESNILKGVVGENIYSDSVKQQTLITEDYRQKGKVFSSSATGALGSKVVSDKPVKKNTFFGK
ncbi:nucleotidyltransferase [Prolixibacter sp. NT017]|uniref:nucleotidyltransferase domain-containing protein n=1 Tax=Prolixibacter sp. NT017 TaxID=2652390 RepID=UPI00126D1361|nr:nucleotidyltransferase [Prolixibacter sp. NT017]GET26073.1 nucleotidyltransferase [Prolixibacter sp. NT017]